MLKIYDKNSASEKQGYIKLEERDGCLVIILCDEIGSDVQNIGQFTAEGSLQLFILNEELVRSYGVSVSSCGEIRVL